MGNSPMDGAPASEDAAAIHCFYSAASWIEGAAVDQLHHIAGLPGVRRIAAFPDLHPGKYGPVGCAVLATRLYPHFIGNDIGCGMALFALDIPLRKIRLDKAARKLRSLQGPWPGDAAERLVGCGLPGDLYAQGLGTIGGGNHFCELQGVSRIAGEVWARQLGLSEAGAYLLVHSGSRALGMDIFSAVQPQSAQGLELGSEAAEAYLAAHDQAIAWAALNRRIIAERAARALSSTCRLITDAPHNLAERGGQGILHRKGAARADQPFVPLAGSRDALSYVLKPSGRIPEALASLAHGSGRKYDRRSMQGRVGRSRAEREKLQRTSFGGQVICDDRQLLVEEAPAAYKNPGQVLQDLQTAGLADCVAAMKPLITFKKAGPDQLPRKKPARRDRRRRSR